MGTTSSRWAAGLVLGLAIGLVPATAAADSTQQTLINQDRAASSLAPLSWSDCLLTIAQQNAQRIANQGYLSHTNGPTLDLACGINSTSAGENVAYMSGGINDPQANTMFMNSAPHRANILGSYNYVATAWVVAANGYGYIAEEFLNAPTLVTPAPTATLSSGPGIASWGPGRLDIFVRGSDNALWHKFYASSFGWSGWSSLGGQLAADPAAISWGPGRLDIFAQGTDNALWHIYYDAANGGWSNWISHGGTIASGPDVASWGPGRLDVFVRGTDNTLQHMYYSSGWSGWSSLGGSLASDPAAVAWGYGRLDVFGRAADNSIMHITYDYTQGGWSGWNSLGGTLASGPTVTTWGPGRLDVFARGTDNALWHAYFASGTWSGWSSLAGVLASDPGAIAWGPGRIDIFAGATGNTLVHRYYDVRTGGWSGWYSEVF